VTTKADIDTDRIDDAVLALLLLGVCDVDRDTGQVRVWKSFDWAAMNRLYEKGLIHDPVSKAKSVWLTEEGAKKAEALFEALFTKTTAE
jgi:preprotein translocase subunit SecA